MHMPRENDLGMHHVDRKKNGTHMVARHVSMVARDLCSLMIRNIQHTTPMVAHWLHQQIEIGEAKGMMSISEHKDGTIFRTCLIPPISCHLLQNKTNFFLKKKEHYHYLKKLLQRVLI